MIQSLTLYQLSHCSMTSGICNRTTGPNVVCLLKLTLLFRLVCDPISFSIPLVPLLIASLISLSIPGTATSPNTWAAENIIIHEKTNNVGMRHEKTRPSLCISSVWSESMLSVWRMFGSLVTHWVYSEDSDSGWSSLCLAVTHFSWFCHIGIKHGFSCISICQVRKETLTWGQSPRFSTSPEGPGEH